MRSAYGSQFFINWPSASLRWYRVYIIIRLEGTLLGSNMWGGETHNAYLSLSILPSSSNDLKAATTTSSSSDPEN